MYLLITSEVYNFYQIAEGRSDWSLQAKMEDRECSSTDLRIQMGMKNYPKKILNQSCLMKRRKTDSKPINPAPRAS